MKYDAQTLSTDSSRPGFSDDIATDMVANSNAVFVTGRSRGFQSGDDYATVAYNAITGAQMWATREDQSDFDVPNAIALSPDGRSVYVTGETEVDGKSREYYTVAYDAATGVQRWQVIENGSIKIDWARDVEVSPDGTLVIVTGDSQIPISPLNAQFDAVTVAYRASDGTQVWKQNYNGPTNSFDFGRALAVMEGTVFLSSASRTSTGSSSHLDYATVAYNIETGVQRWASRFGTPQADEPFDIVVDPGGSQVYVTGESDSDILTVAHNAVTGAQAWVDRFSSPDPNPTTSTRGGGRAITTSPSGDSIYVTGDTYVIDDLNITTLAYSRTGTLLKSAVFPSTTGNDFARDVVAARSGSEERVFVTGERENPSTGRDIILIAYDDKLQQRFVRERGADRNDQAASVAVDSLNALTTVFSTGSDDAPATNFDFDTAAFDASVIAPTPSGSPSTTPSTTPSNSPSGSTSPSVSPSNSTSPSATASTLTSPSGSPSTSMTPSATPTGSGGGGSSPSTSPSPSGSVSPTPSTSTTPSPTPTPSPPSPECDDGIDNDGDGRIDFSGDDGCESPTDDSEFSPDPVPTSCAEVAPGDRIERPGDGLVIGGTAGDDRLSGTRADDLICGFGGDDFIRGRGGNDFITGGSGGDVLRGGSSDDILKGGAGADLILGNPGSDEIFGGRGADEMRGATGSDVLKGGRGADALFGGRGPDILNGGPGRNRCFGGPGRNDLTNC